MKQRGQTLGCFVKKTQTEQQTVQTLIGAVLLTSLIWVYTVCPEMLPTLSPEMVFPEGFDSL